MKRISRRTKVTIVAGLAVAGISVGAWILHMVRDPRDVPAGQPPLVRIDATTIQDVKNEFNSAASRTRIVALFSPT